ncbi:hypothetical protein JCM10213_002430 [Rhodosporidiobolus nylandii]
MSRPFSPDSHSPLSDPCTPSSAARRTCRSLVVEAHAEADAVRTVLYCKVSLPTPSPSTRSTSLSATNEARQHLLNLLPLSRVLSSAVHPLPLHPGDSPEAVHAARTLGLTAPEGGEGTIGRRRSLSAARFGERREARVVTQDGEVALLLLPRAEDEEDLLDMEFDSPQTVRAPSRTGSLSPTPSAGGCAAAAGKAEFLVVLELESRFGALRLPGFANTILIPTPLCLRNTLSFTLPPPPSAAASPSWDLSVRPSLSNFTSAALPPSPSQLPGASEGTRISGTFPSAPFLSLRWAPQIPSAVAQSALVVPRVSLDVRWRIAPEGAAMAEIDVEGTFECCALREKQWVEVEVGTEWQGEGPDDGEEAFEVVACDGEETPVLAWEVAPASAPAVPASLRSSSSPVHGAEGEGKVAFPPLLPRLPSVLDDFSSPLDDSLLSLSSSLSSTSTTAPTEYPFTPTPASRPAPRRRPSSYARAKEHRPPSFTSLFDTAPPTALDVAAAAEAEVSLLDADLPPEPAAEPEDLGRDRRSREKGSEGSNLMGQEAPFDPEASVMDMSFEVAGDGGEESEDGGIGGSGAAVDTRPPTPDRPATRVRVQMDLAPLLMRLATSAQSAAEGALPSFSFTLRLDFPASSLAAPSGDRGDALRLALPWISLSAAHHEETVVTVSSTVPGKRVEPLATSLPPYHLSAPRGDGDEPPASPLPGVGGSARWSTLRVAGELSRSGRRRKGSGVAVEVEVLPLREGRVTDEAAEERRFLPPSASKNEREEPTGKVSPPPPSPSPPSPQPHALSSPADDLALPRPSTAQSTRTAEGSTSSFLSSPSCRGSGSGSGGRSFSSGSHADASAQRARGLNSLSLVRVQITPVPPPSSSSSPWRVFHRLRFHHPYNRVFSLPVPPCSQIFLAGAWTDAGGPVKVAGELSPPLDETGRRELRVDVEGRGTGEVLYVTEYEAAESVNVGDTLPLFGEQVARMEIEVEVPQGYTLDSTDHGFDLVSPPSASGSTMFTRFLVPPSAAPGLAISLHRLSKAEPVLAKPQPLSPTVSPRSSRPSARSLLGSILFSALVALISILAFHLSRQYLFPSSSPDSEICRAPAVPIPPPVTHTHFFTSTITSTFVSTSVSTASATSVVVSTTTHFRTRTRTLTETSMATATRTETPYHPHPSPSSTASLASSPPRPPPSTASFPSFAFTDDLPPASPSSSSAPLRERALTLDDSARTALAAFEAWVRRMSCTARSAVSGWARWMRWIRL